MATIAATPKDVVLRNGTASLYRFRRKDGVAPAAPLPILLVPSMINRWYVLDLRPGASLAEALVDAGHDVFLLDWGIPEDEDRYLAWPDVVAKIERAARVVRRTTGALKMGVLGYCMGATLAGIHAALHPDDVAALVNLAGPFDFSKAGLLGAMVDEKWFDPVAITSAGNLSPMQMQSGFLALRPTGSIGKWVALFDKGHDPKARDAFDALEQWASDNIPFPGAAYVTYIQELYQQNLLFQGKHWVGGKRVDLGAITCPVMTVAADRDAICPVDAARALNDLCSAKDKQLFVAPGGHVGAVVGSRASAVLYPAISKFFKEKLCGSIN